MIAVRHSYQLSYQASLELLVFVWIQTYSQERQTKIICMYSFSYWEFMLQNNIVISILGKKRKSGFSTILVIF